MTSLKKRLLAGSAVGIALASALTLAITARNAQSSDHADTPQIAASPGTDLTDVFVFPSPTNSNNVVLAMCVSPLIPAGGAATRQFDPTVLYQFKIDNNGDKVEDLVIQAKFDGTGGAQTVSVAGPTKPERTGTDSTALAATGTGGINTVFTTGSLKVFAGARSDPFFFDLEQFFTIFPDRATPVTGDAVPVSEANVPKATTWRKAGVAKDFLSNLNVLAIVVEVPKTAVRGSGDGKIGVWCTTSR